MEREELYRLLGLEIAGELERAGGALDWAAAEPLLVQMLDMDTAAGAYEGLRRALGEDGDGMKMLCCQLECARRAWDMYRARRIPEEIYRDTMACFPRFLAESRRRYGRTLFDRGWWTYRQTSMSLFRVGALEYELRPREGAVAVHIPSDADFSREAVDASLDRADDFFRTYCPGYGYDTYTCNSWLLSPALVPFLSGTSHIRSFQERFDILREDRGDREFLEWLFCVPPDTPAAELPAATSLQKGVRDLLLHGGAVGSAYGVLRRTQ